MDEEQQSVQSSYAKRPLWQWILLYVVIGGIVYAIIYFAFFHKQNPYTYKPSAQSAASTKTLGNSVYKSMSKDKVGTVMTDPKGMTLYTFAKDTTGVSSCTGKCLANWPAYIAPARSGTLPAHISVITRPDGSLQYAYNGMPLYFYIKDGDSGDAYGQGIGGVWSVIKL